MTTVPEPTEEQIREELAKIVASPQFVKGEKVCRFLRYVVEETLAGRPENLKEYNIGVVVYERRPDYETKSDSTVRVEASRLRTKLIEYYAGPGAESRVRIELPKGSYVPKFAAVPVARPVEPIAPRHGWAWVAAGAAAVVLAGAWGLQSRSGAGVTVLVAPFVALDGKKTEARALTDALLGEIPKRTGWAAREVSEQSEAALLDRVRQSHAAYLVSGSVRDGHAVVTLQTGDAGYKLWSRMFPMSAAGAIAEALGKPGTRPPSPGTTNAEAARHYLEGHRILSTAKPRTTRPKEWPPHIVGSLQEFERAVELDPNFAAAWAVIASTLHDAGEWDAGKRGETLRKSKEAAMRALQIDESIAEAHRVLGGLAMYEDWDVKEAAYRYSRAVELEPRNADLQREYATALSVQERHEDAAREIERAELSDPGVSPISAGLAEVYFLARRHAEARQQARRAIALSQDNSFAHWLLAVNSELDGDFAEAEREYKWCLKKYSLDSRAITGLAHLRARQKQYPEARTMMENAIRQWGTQDGWNCSLALVSWEGGDRERARRALQRCAEFRDGSALFVLVDPRYDGMRQTPEYQAILRRAKR